MKHKVSELEGALLDAAVAKAQGMAWQLDDDGDCWATPAGAGCDELFRPSVWWEDGGPIIERERIELHPNGGGIDRWQAICIGFPDGEDDGIWYGIGPTPLIAAMRAFVASRFGEEVEIEER